MGAWYLVSLFTFRMLMPNLIKVKGILMISILVNVLICLSTNIGKEFGLNKSLGFFVFFLLGYLSTAEGIVSIKKRIARKVAIITLLVLLIVTVIVSKKLDYSLCLSILTRSANISNFNSRIVAIVSYFITFILTLIVSILVIIVIPEKSRLLEHFGRDTMPMYLSHLIVFMACGFLIDKGNWSIAVIVLTIMMFGSLALFSSNFYEKNFNKILGTITKFMIKQ